MKAFLSVLLFSVFFLLNGCIEIATLIRVNNDGSGEVEETVMISSEIIKMIRELSQSMPPDSGEANEPFKLFDEEELRSQAASFGPGVEYVSGKELIDDTKEGFMAVYSFKDLNELTINQNPNSKIPFGEVDDSEEVQEELVKFKFIKGDPAEIEINFIDMSDINEETPEDTTIITDSTMTDTTFNEVAKMMRDMKITLAVEPQGNIEETNATHISGNRITLFDIDFNELLSNEEKFEEFKKIQPQSFEEFKQVVKDIPGIKVEFNQPVIIKFQ